MHTVEVNLIAAMLLTRAVLPGMLDRQRGHIVNISSGAGKVGVPFAVAYATSKHGLVGFTNSLRCEYLKSPVGFSVVCPGFVTETGMYARWEDHGAKAPKLVGRSTPDKVAHVVVRCIQKNRGEALVNTLPVRPLIVLFNIATPGPSSGSPSSSAGVRLPTVDRSCLARKVDSGYFTLPIASGHDLPGSFNGRTSVFGAVYRGSNPLPGTQQRPRSGGASPEPQPTCTRPTPDLHHFGATTR